MHCVCRTHMPRMQQKGRSTCLYPGLALFSSIFHACGAGGKPPCAAAAAYRICFTVAVWPSA